jgi:hypothetical protein
LAERTRLTAPDAKPEPEPQPLGEPLREEAGTLRGFVLGAEGAPQPGATVTLVDHGGRQLGLARAGADGGYTLRVPEGEPQGSGSVLVGSAPGHLPEATPFAVPGPVAGAVRGGRFDILLRPAGAVRGAVRARGGRPLADARVTLIDAAGHLVGTRLTGEDGSYAFTGIPEGQYTLVAGGYGPAAAPLAVRGEDRAGHDLHLTHERQDPAAG